MSRKAAEPQELSRSGKLAFGRWDDKNWFVADIKSKDGIEHYADVLYYTNFMLAAKSFGRHIGNAQPITGDLDRFASKVDRCWAKFVQDLRQIESDQERKAA